MTAQWRSSWIDAGDRADALRETVWATVLPVEIDHHVPARRLYADLRLSNLGRMRILTAEATRATVRRTPMLARDDSEPMLKLSLQVRGSGVVIQHDREAVLRPGEFAVYETTAPYTLEFDHGGAVHMYFIPRDALALPSGALRDLLAVPFGPTSPMGGLAGRYLARLAASPDLRAGTFADNLAQPSIELVRAVIASRMSDPAAAVEPMRGSLPLQIMEYLRAHLAEHDLSATRIARAHNISVRYLYAVLAREGISLGDWIRVHRLEQARNDLARPGSRGVTIAAIAHRWGFADPAHFSRVFKDAYGMTPRDWRELSGRMAGSLHP